MSITLTLTGNTSVLVAGYFPPIELDQNYQCALISLDTYNSIPNVDVGNNLFYIGKHTIKIPVCSYEISDINDLLTRKYTKLTKNEPDGSPKFYLVPNYNTLQSEIFSATDKIYFNKEKSIGSLLGFTSNTFSPNILHTSDKAIDITKISSICIQCNIINGTYINSETADTLHQLALVVSPGYKITEVPQNVIYLPVNTKEIHSITLKICDQDGNLVNFRG